MATYYVGIGGNDGNNGTTWALRKLTLNGAEDLPVAAGDTVYVGPGAYRELLTCDVSGSSGSPITYIGDVTGENTDGVGGIVRITGSDNDQSAARANCVNASSINYRTFRGFHFDMVSTSMINITNGTNWIIEDCTFECGVGAANGIYVDGASQSTNAIRRCWFWGWKYTSSCIIFIHTSEVANSGHTVDNCFFQGGYSIKVDDVGSVQIKDCTFTGGSTGVIQWGSISAGQETDIYNSLFFGLNKALWATAAGGYMTEDYCTFNSNDTDRTNVATGANSLTYPASMLPPILLDRYRYPRFWGELSEWSQVARIAGSSANADDIYGIVRPTTATKKSWGAFQLREGERETGTTRGGSTASIKLADAGDHAIIVPVTNASTTFSVYVYREANYAGTNPRLIIRQPGQSDDVTTDAAAASQWNELTTTLTPAANPPYVIAILRNLNTATSGSYAVYFDDLDVS